MIHNSRQQVTPRSGLMHVSAATRVRVGVTLRVTAAVSAAVLVAAAGFAVARSLGGTTGAPTAVCSETCAPAPTAPPRASGSGNPTTHGANVRPTQPDHTSVRQRGVALPPNTNDEGAKR